MRALWRTGAPGHTIFLVWRARQRTTRDEANTTKMANVKKAADTAGWILSYIFRPGVFLIVGLAAGYYFGFSAGYHGGDSIGMKVASALGKVDPENVRATRQARSAEIRDTINARSGVSALDSIIK